MCKCYSSLLTDELHMYTLHTLAVFLQLFAERPVRGASFEDITHFPQSAIHFSPTIGVYKWQQMTAHRHNSITALMCTWIAWRLGYGPTCLKLAGFWLQIAAGSGSDFGYRLLGLGQTDNCICYTQTAYPMLCGASALVSSSVPSCLSPSPPPAKQTHVHISFPSGWGGHVTRVRAHLPASGWPGRHHMTREGSRGGAVGGGGGWKRSWQTAWRPSASPGRATLWKC